MNDKTLVERLLECPNIEHARIVAPDQRVPECVVPIALRDEAATRIEALEARLEVEPSHSYDGIDARDATIRLLEQRIEALEDTLPPVGANGLYLCYGLSLSCTVIGHVEGWLEVKFHNDQSTCVVRPSRFNPQGSKP